MSLYYDTAPLLLPNSDQLGSLKSRVFNSTKHKSPPRQIFALLSQASKWSPVLSEVIENSQLLQLEQKLSPNLALLLVHDLLLTKRGISAPSSHPLRLSVERHKARLSAELTRVRLKRGLATIEALRAQINAKDHIEDGAIHRQDAIDRPGSETRSEPWPHSRWVRVNTIKSDMKEQLGTTFAGYKVVESLDDLLRCSLSSAEKFLHVDKHVPNLLALPPATDLSKTRAYVDGQIILQDKASCFPAYLLNPQAQDGDILDACAAPGNKTSHLAAILHSESRVAATSKIYAFERDKNRASTLRTLLETAGVQRFVTPKVGQDFLKIDPADSPWNGIGTLLLDPSCSGSGIVGRDEILHVVLPSKKASEIGKMQSKKRKKKSTTEFTPIVHNATEISEEIPTHEIPPSDQLPARLNALSTFQLKLLLHAFHFPNARKITYSTCSIYAEENEHVVMKALTSSIAQERGWRILKREDQIPGMKAWNIRGKVDACFTVNDIANDNNDDDGGRRIKKEEIAEACIRCEKGTREGTQGFFVAGFVRDLSFSNPEPSEPLMMMMDEEWEGFSDSGSHS